MSGLLPIAGTGFVLRRAGRIVEQIGAQGECGNQWHLGPPQPCRTVLRLMRSLRKSRLMFGLAGSSPRGWAPRRGIAHGRCRRAGRGDGRPAQWMGPSPPLPPEVRDGSSYLATNDQILVFGGCGERPRYDCRPTRDGFAYSPANDRWARMPTAPFAPMGSSVWTGDEAIFLNTGTAYKEAGTPRSVRAVAFDPGSNSWRRLPSAPLRVKDSDAIWTGSEVIVWGGGGRRSDSAADGAAFDPATDEWRKIARAPIELNNVNLTWTGAEMIAFGSRLDHGNHASTRVAIGAAYDPASDSWKRIADSKLSPQAESTAWAGGRVVAYDYSPDYQLYNPATDTWSPKRPMPLRFGECYPDSAAVPGGVLANFCGQVATFDSASRRWSNTGRHDPPRASWPLSELLGHKPALESLTGPPISWLPAT